MHPSRRVWISALVLTVLAATALSAPSRAQMYEDVRHAAQLSPDPLQRSPRMLGFGRLELVVDDEHTRFTMWDFAGNPTGIYAADSGSTLELRPRTGSSSMLRDQLGSSTDAVQQTLAARDVDFGFEAWRRAAGATAYGFVGEVATVRLDHEYSSDVELRRSVQVPRGQAILSGPMPFLFSEHGRFALRGHFGSETLSDEYRRMVTNRTGTWLDRDGSQIDTPLFFTPDQVNDDQLGGGLAMSYDVGKSLTAAAGYDLIQHKLRSDNTGKRYVSKIDENQPVHNGQFSVVGRVGPHLQFGADARGWRETSEASWLFTISAGVGAIPLSGRGKLFQRDEEGTTLRTRARWTQGPLQLGASLNTHYRKTEISAPEAGDITSLNYFLNTLFYRQGADTLAFPDSIRDVVSEERAYEVGGGIAWTALPHHAQLGVEFHAWRDASQTDLGGAGPKPVGWDVRSGLEVPLTKVLTARGGYIYRWDDLDDFTRSNEYVTHSVTLGLGLHPAGAVWSVESGYVLDMTQADFGDPSLPRGNRQQLAAELRWGF